jgi:hypothetical protein
MCESLTQSSDCNGMSLMNRRRWLGAASIAASSPWLTLVSERLARGEQVHPEKSANSLIVLWLQGGPSQLETFDPHAGKKIGGDVQAIRTSVKGFDFAGSLPRLAERADQLSVIRSMVSKEGDHERATYHIKTGWRPDPTILHPSIGAVVCHQLSDDVEIPRHISILAGQWPARGGYMGSRFDAFQTSDPRFPLPNLQRIDQDPTILTRVKDLEYLEQQFAVGRRVALKETLTPHESATDQALKMMSSEQIKAFEISREDETVKMQFGDTPFGRGCLAALRLIEEGVRCVEVELSGWDTHANNHALQYSQAEILDQGFSALIDQLKERGLWEKTIVFCAGEFGRTPVINPLAGRDHWPHGFSVALAGGSIRRGLIHGATTSQPKLDVDDKTVNVESPVEVPDLHASLLHALGVNHALELQTPIGRPLKLSQGNPLPFLRHR